MYTKICELCGKEFQTKYKRQRFCKDKHYRECEICGKSFELKYPPYTTKTCSKRCAFEKSRRDGTMAKGRELSKKTMLERYGVEHALQNDAFLKKSQDTCMKHYGVNNPLQSEEIKHRVRNTCMTKYSVDNPSKSESVKSKIKDTFIKHYGVDNPMKVDYLVEKQRDSTERSCGSRFALQSESGKQHLAETVQKKYGVKGASCTFDVPEIRKKINDSMIRKYGNTQISKTQYWRTKVQESCIEKYGVNWPCQTKQCREASGKIISSYNIEFAELLDELGIQYSFEKRVEEYEYDLCLERNKTLIEINPTYTHNCIWNHFQNKGLDKLYHKNKTDVAQRNRYRCIHVFDWDNWEDVVELILPRNSMYARKCTVQSVGLDECIEFENNYHIQKACKGQIKRYGLYHDGELLELMTFGNPRYNRKYDFELLRLCTKSGISVVGGASKLFAAFLRDNPDKSVISYCDLSKFSGEVYINMGMKLHHITEPSKIWSKEGRYVRDSLLRQRGYDQLFNASYGKGASNEELMVEHGWLPVYDCGMSVYEYLPNMKI